MVREVKELLQMCARYIDHRSWVLWGFEESLPEEQQNLNETKMCNWMAVAIWLWNEMGVKADGA